MRIGFFSDPFSPPHVGQTVAAAAFMEQMWLDTLYVVPTLNDASAVPYADRLALCRRAFEGREGIVVSDLALRYPMLAGNVGVARHLSDLFGGDSRIFCLLGTDTLLLSETETCAGALFSACYPCYYRNDTDTALDDKIVQKIAEYYEKYHKIVRRIITDAVPISSGDVRHAVEKGQPFDHMTAPAVAVYIREKRLYHTGEET